MTTIINTEDLSRQIPWRNWPWQRRCKAMHNPNSPKVMKWLPLDLERCDLTRGHQCDHIAERGMFSVIWSTRRKDG